MLVMAGWVLRCEESYQFGYANELGNVQKAQHGFSKYGKFMFPLLKLKVEHPENKEELQYQKNDCSNSCSFERRLFCLQEMRVVVSAQTGFGYRSWHWDVLLEHHLF